MHPPLGRFHLDHTFYGRIAGGLRGTLLVNSLNTVMWNRKHGVPAWVRQCYNNMKQWVTFSAIFTIHLLAIRIRQRRHEQVFPNITTTASMLTQAGVVLTCFISIHVNPFACHHRTTFTIQASKCLAISIATSTY